MQFILNRLKERSTWVGITALISALGVKMDPTVLDSIAVFGMAAVGLIMAIWPDKAATPNLVK